MDNERINILIGSDINYAPYYGVMLTSLFVNNKDSQFNVYLMTDSTWPVSETRKFERFTARYNSRFFVYKVDENSVKDFPQTSHITLPAYYRLIASRVLPSSVHKILYLDGDMVVNGDIRPLWNMDLTGKAIAGVVDCAFENAENYSRLDYDKSYSYINAGVALYNFDYWREHHISEKSLQYLTENPEKALWMDQDVVNALLHADKVLLPIAYNFQVYFFYRHYWKTYNLTFKEQILETSNKPVIIHYNGKVKPWHYLYYGYPYLRVWLQYERLSAWRCRVNWEFGRKWLRYAISRLKGTNEALKIRNIECVEESYNL